ncbi:MAG: terminase large subunit domain-containing protein [Pseudomonadales bacterium]
MQSAESGISVTGDYRERAWAAEVHDGLDCHRNGVVIAHRRAGKTVCIIAQLIRVLFRCVEPNPQVAYIAPTARQARVVAWAYFNQMLSDIPGAKFREHEMIIELPGGRRILFASGEQFDRLRGLYLDAAGVDEMADCPEALITTVLVPALSDRKGKLYLIGTVKGRGPFWQAYLRALEDPDWYAGKYLPDQTNVVDPDELEYLKRTMSVEEYRQEMLCDPDAAVKGSYYGRMLAGIAEQVTAVPHEPDLSVTLAMDIGLADATAVWCAQLHRGGEIRLIDYFEYQNTSFSDILGELKALPYHVGRWIGPHDLKVREYMTAQSRLEGAQALGVSFEIAPKLGVRDGIDAVGRALSRCWFDKVKTERGLEALRLYRSQYDEKHRVMSRNPVHDWTSHAADAFRYLITGTDGGQASTVLDLPALDYGEEQLELPSLRYGE